MPNRYKLTELEKVIRIIEWEDGTDFKSQLEYMARHCGGWEVIAIYAKHKASTENQEMTDVKLKQVTK